MSYSDAFSVKSTLNVNGKAYSYFSLPELEKKGIGPVSKLPFSIKVLLEAALRQMDGVAITEDHVKLIANWPETKAQKEGDPLSTGPYCAAGLYRGSCRGGLGCHALQSGQRRRRPQAD